MQPAETMRSPVVQRKDSLRRARQLTLGAWLFGLASVGLTSVQARWYVFHPHYLPLGLLFIGLAASTVAALALCLWRAGRGPQRQGALLLALVAVIPAAFWAGVGYTAHRNWQERWVPNTFVMNLAKVMGATFIRAEADYEYPRRLETGRLIMQYRQLDRPDGDLAAMDQHLARMEKLLGEPISSRVYWVRGSLPRLGIGWCSLHGLALGSEFSPGIAGDDRGDRHELAHAALDSYRNPGSNPPCVLHEGWAMAQCGDGRSDLAREAVSARRDDPAMGIRKLLSPEWYYRDAGPVYSVGGALVEFLIRTRGAARFRRFYVECQPDLFEAKCGEIYGIDLDKLDAEFWDDVQNTLRGQGADG
jgi:hypothetical protein